jgi:membrane associated rhomboid family serine protease
MTSTTVGMRCPECANQRTKVVRMRDMRQLPRVTYALIAINVIAFLGEGQFSLTSSGGGGTLVQKGELYGPAVSIGHEYWRLVTSGFLHENLLHIGFNMYLLYLLGMMLEPSIGSLRFGAIYFTALLAGSFGALLLNPLSPSLGASGAVFGLMGAAAVELRMRRLSIMQSGIGGLILLNLVISFTFSGISIGAHIGGLIGGGLAALAMHFADRQRSVSRRGLSLALGLAACALLSVLAVAGALAAAHSSTVA